MREIMELQNNIEGRYCPRIDSERSMCTEESCSAVGSQESHRVNKKEEMKDDADLGTPKD